MYTYESWNFLTFLNPSLLLLIQILFKTSVNKSNLFNSKNQNVPIVYEDDPRGKKTPEYSVLAPTSSPTSSPKEPIYSVLNKTKFN